MKIVFICTHNRCRSILSEAIARDIGGERLQVFSAGSQPAGEIHPNTLKYLKQNNYSTHNLRSKSWDELETHAPDVIVTVCDNAKGEACPVWFNNAIQVHWGLSDPSKLSANETVIQSAFTDVIRLIEKRINALLALPFESSNRADLADALLTIGQD